jgi:chemotaxis response regulator CheB
MWVIFRAAPITKSVLIVDDNAYIRQAGANCSNKKRTLKYAQKQRTERKELKRLELRPDLIVLDLSLPVMNGLDAARVLKRLMPTVPLIMCSEVGVFWINGRESLFESPGGGGGSSLCQNVFSEFE